MKVCVGGFGQSLKAIYAYNVSLWVELRKQLYRTALVNPDDEQTSRVKDCQPPQHIIEAMAQAAAAVLVAWQHGQIHG